MLDLTDRALAYAARERQKASARFTSTDLAAAFMAGHDEVKPVTVTTANDLRLMADNAQLEPHLQNELRRIAALLEAL